MFSSPVFRRSLLTKAPAVRAAARVIPTRSTAFSARLTLPKHLPSRTFSTTRTVMAASETGKEPISVLNNKDEFHSALKEDDKLMVIDCYATWCGPCKVIAPQVAKYAGLYTDARFYKLDVDEVPDVAQELGIRAMPTFVFFKGGEKLEEVVGANPKAIEAGIKKHIDSAPA